MLEILLALIPLMLLLASLLLGHYPGCEAIVRFSEWLVRGARVRRLREHRLLALLFSRVVGGGRLIASGHAQRPPPLAP
jgi:hypothetical protein